MTHLPYIIASYGLTIGVVAWLAVGAWQRTSRAQKMLAELDRRNPNQGART